MITLRRIEPDRTRLEITVPQSFNPRLIEQSFRVMESGENVGNAAGGLPWSRAGARRGWAEPRRPGVYAHYDDDSRFGDVTSEA